MGKRNRQTLEQWLIQAIFADDPLVFRDIHFDMLDDRVRGHSTAKSLRCSRYLSCDRLS